MLAMLLAWFYLILLGLFDLVLWHVFFSVSVAVWVVAGGLRVVVVVVDFGCWFVVGLLVCLYCLFAICVSDLLLLCVAPVGGLFWCVFRLIGCCFVCYLGILIVSHWLV